MYGKRNLWLDYGRFMYASRTMHTEFTLIFLIGPPGFQLVRPGTVIELTDMDVSLLNATP